MTESKRVTEHVSTESADLLAERREALRQLVPEAFSEGRIDFEKLREALGDLVDDRPERYTFTWAGKRDAIRLLQTPSRATLVPCPEESVNWDSTEHLFLEGDNLEVLKLLYKSYAGRVKMIYIDPPYNTGNDFVYPDNFADPLATYLELTGQKDSNGNLLTSNPETSGRYHSAWLSMMYPRLFIARQLLREDGVILASIDDTEVHNLRMAMNEVFGEENFIAHIVWQKRYVSNMTAKYLSDMHDHILVFGKSISGSDVSIRKLDRSEEQLKAYKNPDNDPRGPWRAQDLSASKYYKAGEFTITTPAGVKCDPPPGRYWRCNREQYEKWLSDNRIWFGVEGTARPMLKAFLSGASNGVTPNTWWAHDFAGHNKEATLEVKELFDGAAPFDTSKPVKLIRRMLEIFADENAIVVDFFAGSCTTAHAVLENNASTGANQRFIVCQFPEPTSQDSIASKSGFRTIADVGIARIERAIARLIKIGNGKISFADVPPDLGFRVFKLAESHFARWRGTAEQSPEELIEQMKMFQDPLLEGWTEQAVIFEVLLKEGYSLSSRVERVSRDDVPNTVHRVTDGERGQSFRICLDDKIDPEIARALELGKDDLFVCRDVALDDTLAANLALQCRLRTI